MPRNEKLKKAIVDSGRTQWFIASAAEIPESVVSQMVTGARKGTQDQRERLARVLGKKIEELFEVPKMEGKP